jgi:hypothetical protein
MDEFTVTTKLWPSGANLDLGTDSNTVTVPSSFNRHAANFVTSMDGTHNYQFLFWNTGRHVTNKRHVRWNFSVGGWGLWNATRWYGTPPGIGNGGPSRVLVEPFTLGGNEMIMTNTPINGPASVFAPGAYPFMGNDREIGTASGLATVVAKDPFNDLQFAGWLQLLWGGDDTGEFIETDTGDSPGSPTFYPIGSGPFTVPSGQSADLLATYGNSTNPPSGFIDIRNIYEAIREFNFGPENPGDNAVVDRIRLSILGQLFQKAQPAGPAGPDFQRFIDAAPRMNHEELNRAKQSVQTTLDLGKTALSVLDAQLKRG